MYRRIAILALIPGGLFAQALTELQPLEYRPPRPEASGRAGGRPALSFERRVPPPVAYRLGAIRQEEMNAVARDRSLTLVGIERAIDRRVRQAGEWVTLDDGRTVWRMAIQSDGAWGIRVYFSGFAVGEGEVWLYSQDHAQVAGPYTGTGSGGDEYGGFWSNTVFADSVVVEYQPETPRSSTPFTISKVGHLLRPEEIMAAGSCELDVSCYSDWSPVASGVGMYIFQKGGGTYVCTGALVNNSNHDYKPYFLTANHCMSDAATARTVEVFWNYQTPACNGRAPSLSSVPTTLGATYMASAGIGSGDFSLIQLSSLPNASLVFYGWNASAAALQVGDRATGIHHPSADYKRISFGVRDPDRTALIGSEIAPSNLYYQIRETAGRIEPGSSGSPLFTQDKTVVGTLTYGPAGDACSISPFSAGYARFSAAYPSLSAYLSPPPPGGTPSSGSTPPPAVTVTATPASLHSGWTINGASPAAQTIQLTTTSASAITLTARASQPWILLSAASVTVRLANPAALSVSLNVQAFSAAGSYSGSVTLSATGVTQSIPVQVDVTAPVVAVKGGPVTVIPLFQDSVGVSTSFTLTNPYGTATNASISFAAANGATVPLPVGQSQASSWQNVTIPAFGTVTVTTAASSTPPKQGIAVIQSGDAAKRVQALALINSDVVPAALPVAPPLVVPFDATSSAGTTLYIYNASTTDTATLRLTIYDTSGSVAGTGQITIPPQLEGAIAMFKSTAVFGGRKGLLYVDGKGSLLVMGIRTAYDGRLSSVIPAAVAQ